MITDLQRERACPVVGLPPRPEEDPVAYLGTVGQGAKATYDVHSGVTSCPQGLYMESSDALEVLWLLNRSRLTRAERVGLPYRTIQALMGAARHLT